MHKTWHSHQTISHHHQHISPASQPAAPADSPSALQLPDERLEAAADRSRLPLGRVKYHAVAEGCGGSGDTGRGSPATARGPRCLRETVIGEMLAVHTSALRGCSDVSGKAIRDSRVSHEVGIFPCCCRTPLYASVYRQGSLLLQKNGLRIAFFFLQQKILWRCAISGLLEVHINFDRRGTYNFDCIDALDSTHFKLDSRCVLNGCDIVLRWNWTHL